MENLVAQWSVPIPAAWLVLLRLAVGLIWLRSGLLKAFNGEYLEFEEKLDRFISKNPYPWYVAFLKRSVLPYSLPVGYFFVSAEVLLGILLILGLLTAPAAIVASFFNLNFRLAAGWQNPAIPSLNYLLILCQLILIFAGAGNYVSLDALLFGA